MRREYCPEGTSSSVSDGSEKVPATRREYCSEDTSSLVSLLHAVQFTYAHHLQLNHPCWFELNKKISISHILDSWRLQEGSSNEKRVLPRRYLFFSKWWLWEGSSDKKRVLLRRYLFFSKFTNVHHLQWNQPCCIELNKICIYINYDGYCLNWSYLLFRLLYCPTVSQRWEERIPELLL